MSARPVVGQISQGRLIVGIDTLGLNVDKSNILAAVGGLDVVPGQVAFCCDLAFSRNGIKYHSRLKQLAVAAGNVNVLNVCHRRSHERHVLLHQRLGNLDKARDSYEYALDLDAGNLEARSRIATTYVADHDFEMALEYANQIIDEDENHSSALATAAICHGLLNDPVMSKYYTKLAVENGYSQKKIEETIATLKKRVK